MTTLLDSAALPEVAGPPPRARRRRPRRPERPVWTCENCTTPNAGRRRRCEDCGTSRD